MSVAGTRLGLAQLLLLGGLRAGRGGRRGRRLRAGVVLVVAQQRVGRIRAHQRGRLALALAVLAGRGARGRRARQQLLREAQRRRRARQALRPAASLKVVLSARKVYWGPAVYAPHGATLPQSSTQVGAAACRGLAQARSAARLRRAPRRAWRVLASKGAPQGGASGEHLCTSGQAGSRTCLPTSNTHPRPAPTLSRPGPEPRPGPEQGLEAPRAALAALRRHSRQPGLRRPVRPGAPGPGAGRRARRRTLPCGPAP